MHFWVFNCRPDAYDHKRSFREGKVILWRVQGNLATRPAVGDVVFVHLCMGTGKYRVGNEGRGVVAMGEVIGDVAFGEEAEADKHLWRANARGARGKAEMLRVPVRLTVVKTDRPLRSDALVESGVDIQCFRPQGYRGTNIRLSDDVGRRLQTML